jgi:autotransporter-associated beta strand protein
LEPLESRCLLAATVGQNFTGSTFGVNDGSTPPDSDGAIGPSVFVEMINGRFAVYDKATAAVLQSKTLNQFWTDAGAAPIAGAFDPRIIYDHASQRWFASSADNPDLPNDFLLAVSSSSDATAPWHGFAIDSDSADTRWADFPTLGLDADGVYLSANMFDAPGGADEASDITILSVPKKDLLLAAPTVANRTMFENAGAGTRGDVQQPAVDFGPSDSRAAILSAYGLTGRSRTSIVGADGPGAVLTLTTVFPGPTVSAPPPATQPAGLNDLDTGELGFSSSVFEQGNSLWAVESVSLGGRAAIRFYQISETTNLIMQSGVLGDPSSDLFYPSIAANSFGEVAIGFSRSSATAGIGYISSFAIAGTTLGGVTTFGNAILLKRGMSNFHLYDSDAPPRNRWGDYSTTTLDPSDPHHFWTIQEWASGTDVWSTQISELVFPSSSFTLPATGGPFTLLVENGDRELKNNSGAVLTTLPNSGAITINGTDAANDPLIVNLSAGNPLTGGVKFNGGAAGNDRLTFTGGNQGTVTYNYSNGHDGSVVLSNFGTLTYTGLEPISNSGSATDIVFNLPATASTAVLEDDGTTVNGIAQLRSSNGTFETTVFANPSGGVTINRGNAADTLTVNNLLATDFNAGLTIGAAGNEFSTVTFAGGLTPAADKSVSANASSTISFPSSASTIGVTGTGAVTLTTARDIATAQGSHITTVNGDINLSANQQSIPTVGDFAGIVMDGGQIETGGSGKIKLLGRGGDDASTTQHYGVWIKHFAIVDSLARPSAGSITIVGTGGNASDDSAGFRIDSATVSTSLSDLSITGVATAANGSLEDGIRLTLGGTVRAFTSGILTLTGTPSVPTDGTIGVGFRLTNGSVQAPQVVVASDRVDITPGSLAGAGLLTGSVSLRPITDGTSIDLGSTTDTAPHTLELSNTELGAISAAIINVGSTSSGMFTVSAPISRGASFTSTINLTAGTNRNLVFTGSGSLDAENGNFTLLTNSSGTGAILSGPAVVDVTGANVSLTAGSGGIGTSGNPFTILATNLNSTTGGNGNQFLSASGSTTIDATGLSAGSGMIELDGGTFSLGGSERINDATKLGVNGATFAIGANNETVDGLTLASGGVMGGTLISATTYQTQSGSISAILAGSVGLTQTTSGITTLSGANTYSGDTTINDGTLKLGASAVIPDGASKGNVVFNPASGTATLDLNGFGETINGLASSGAGSSIVDNSVAGGPFTLTVGANNATSTFSGVIKNSTATMNLAKSGTGTLTLSGANSYSGTTIIAQGTLSATGGNAIPDTSDVTVASGATFDLLTGPNGTSETVGALYGGGSVTGSHGLTVTGGGSFSGTMTGSFGVFNGKPAGLLELELNAPGKTLSFSGMFSSIDGVVVSHGSLILDGEMNAGDGVGVNGGATLGGAGTISGFLFSGGHLAPGNAGPGIINSDGVFFYDGSNFDVELNGPSVGAQYDQENGEAYFNGSPNLNLTLGFTPVGGETFTIIKTPAADVRGFAGLPEGKVFSVSTGPFEATFQITYRGGPHGSDIVLTTIDTANPVLLGTPGSYDVFVVKRNGNNDDILLKDSGKPYAFVPALIWSTPISSLNSLTIDGDGTNPDGGTDIFSVDSSGGDPFPAGGIKFQGVGALALSNGSSLAIPINGKTAAQPGGYDQLTVSGNIDLADENLVLSGTYTPAIGDRFTVVNNVLVGETTNGTFSGLPEGKVFAATLGGAAVDLQITYKGGDGNDVVLTAVNMQPTLGPVVDQTVAEDASQQQTINLTGITAGGSLAQNVSITAISDKPGIIPNPVVFYNSPDSTGVLQFHPIANQNGLVTITVTVQDDGGTAAGSDTYTQTFTINVTKVNDAPVFVKGDDQAVIDENLATHGLALPIVVHGWATNIAPGPATATDEAGQVLHFSISSSTADSALFAPGGQPALDPATGDLTFTPAPNVDRTAHITIMLSDDGGTAGGGIDISDAQTFDIVISKPHIWHNTNNPLDVLPNPPPAGLDVNDDGHVAANDVVAILNYINAFGSLNGGHVPGLGDPLPNGLGIAGIGKPFGFIDVNADDFVAANDALAIINVINAGQAGREGESWQEKPASDEVDLMTLLAEDVVFQAKRRQ